MAEHQEEDWAFSCSGLAFNTGKPGRAKSLAFKVRHGTKNSKLTIGSSITVDTEVSQAGFGDGEVNSGMRTTSMEESSFADMNAVCRSLKTLSSISRHFKKCMFYSEFVVGERQSTRKIHRAHIRDTITASDGGIQLLQNLDGVLRAEEAALSTSNLGRRVQPEFEESIRKIQQLGEGSMTMAAETYFVH
ncbi:uncharacterized protein FTJAE_252 [Fusarium tjaetaba]|uniref:Uncharacterized protein n=1 Tax=Fusarium tjaetaba TaxID=1567544 RepID=A0A8H5SHI3_9HYPO|nr:uncharacterized protein FTJAE_252 [Fusarium tjaetaba]KAF5651075.1 hypothetical protein FTJAE_252 [Fusarium tjaetaba]